MQFGKSCFFLWMSKIFFLKILKKLKLVGCSKKRCFSGGSSSRSGECSINITVENFGRKPKNLVQCEETITWIKSFEVKTNFLSCFSANVGLFLTTLPEVFPSKSKQNNGSQSFSKKIASLKVLVWKGTTHFRQSCREMFGRKMTKVFAQFPKKLCLSFVEKIIFTTKCPRTRRKQYWKQFGKFCQEPEKVSLKAR